MEIIHQLNGNNSLAQLSLSDSQGQGTRNTKMEKTEFYAEKQTGQTDTHNHNMTQQVSTKAQDRVFGSPEKETFAQRGGRKNS